MLIVSASLELAVVHCRGKVTALILLTSPESSCYKINRNSSAFVSSFSPSLTHTNRQNPNGGKNNTDMSNVVKLFRVSTTHSGMFNYSIDKYTHIEYQKIYETIKLQKKKQAPEI